MEPRPHESPAAAVPADTASPRADEDASAPPATELAPLARRVLVLWWATGLLLLVGVVLVVGVVDLFAPLPLRRGLLTAAVATIVGLGVAIVPILRYRRWRYALRPGDLWIRRGVLWVTVSVIPFSRLQFVDTRQGPLDRIFGLSQLIVHTAAIGTSGRLPGLDAAEAERLRERLAAVEPSADSSV